MLCFNYFSTFLIAIWDTKKRHTSFKIVIFSWFFNLFFIDFRIRQISKIIEIFEKTPTRRCQISMTTGSTSKNFGINSISVEIWSSTQLYSGFFFNRSKLKGIPGIFFVSGAGFSRIFKVRYLRDYLELEKNKNISPHLLVEICSFPGSFEMTETIRGYQNMFSLQKIRR